MQLKIAIGLLSTCLLGCNNQPASLENPTEVGNFSSKNEIDFSSWPKQSSPLQRDGQIEQRITDLLNKMTLEEKVGQVIQADIGSVTPAEAAQYNLGSILNGGNSAPNNDNRSKAEDWLSLADEFWAASVDTSDGGVGIPTIWGIDAVHGHNNVVGATIFPHNIGLGAANDAQLMRKIGQVTAKEILVTGIDWTFAPTLAVVRNDRWGRTYESYSEDPQRIAEYAGPLVEGLQGAVGTDEFLGQQGILATAKHFLGDGGTKDGIDQGDNQSTERQMREIHGAGYPPAIQAGAQVVMASYNSWHGQKMHGYKEMLTGVLVDRMGFDGFVVGDWNGHGQVKGCTNVSCPQAFNAGLDMFMAPDSWKDLYHNTLQQVKSGQISQRRLDQAVSRILRVKLRAGVFEAPKPSERPFAGQFELLGSNEHRQVAREAVRKSLVLLKNNGQLLPLDPTAKVLVTGPGADDIGMQSGGWTLSWQGTGNDNSHFPHGQSIFAGIQEVVSKSGGQAYLSENGQYRDKPDVAIVVFGEQPYAEFQGDRTHLDLATSTGLDLLKQFKQRDIPTVAIFLSGRPMWVNPELNQSDAFIAAWLPGSEGGGVADVLFSDKQGASHYDFTGRLTFSWPKVPDDTQLNVGDDNYDPLFAYGYGLSMADNQPLGPLNETVTSPLSTAHLNAYLYAGDPVSPWQMVLVDEGGRSQITSSIQSSTTGAINALAKDDLAQEDTLLLTFNGTGRLAIEGDPIDISRSAGASMSMQVEYQVLSMAQQTHASIILSCGQDCQGSLSVTDSLRENIGKGWQSGLIELACFAEKGADLRHIRSPFALAVDKGELRIQMRSVKLVTNRSDSRCAL